jgi:hypothetical protein
MDLRFVVPTIDSESERELGVFHAIGDLRRRGALYRYEEDLHDLIIDWFNRNLEKPTRFTTSKRPHHRRQNRAICRFKHTAHDHLDQIRHYVATLQIHGVPVRMLETNRVGYVVYEDKYQIVAQPFSGERY